MEKLKRDSAIPLYAQLEDILKSNISNGYWKDNQMIPSENELAKTYGISRVTVRAVINSLANDGLLYRVQGKGTFVSKAKLEMYGPAWGGVSRQLILAGKNISTDILDYSVTEATEGISRKLNISRESPLRYICRLRYADNEPISIHRTWIPYHLCEDLTVNDVSSKQLCDVMEQKYGLHSRSIKESLEVVPATQFEAKLLNIEVGAPVILMEGLGFDKNNRPYQLAKIVFSGDRVKLKFDYDNVNMLE